MGRGRKILIGAVALIVLLAGNALLVGGETKPAEVTAPGGRILDLQGEELQYVEGGPRGGKAIVLVHCFACSLNWWDRMRPPLEREHRVIAIDMLGFGGSEKPDDGYSIEDQADLLAAALERLAVRDATVIGHSLGGTVVTALAERSPGLVERLVIVDQAPDNSEEYEREGLPLTASLTFVPVLGPALWRVTPDFAIEDGLGAAFAPGYDVPDEFVEDFKRMTYTSYDESPAAETEFTDETPLDERIASAGVPLLAIFGDQEQIYKSEEALAAYGKLPGATTALIKGVGHSPNVEKPAVTARHVLGFVDGESGGDRPNGSLRHEMQEAFQNETPVRPRP